MSIFRKDKPDDGSVKPNTPAAEEEYVDISEAAADASAAPAEGEGEMEEIYSTSVKRINYKNLTPIEFEAAARRQAATKKELVSGKLEFSSDEEPAAPDVELQSEPDPEATVAHEIIEDVQDVRTLKGIYVMDIDDIDISLDPMESLQEYERRANDTERHDARRAPRTVPENPYIRTGEKIVSRVPVYRHDSKVEKLFLKAGRFTDVVESEYDEYLKSTDPTISKNYHTMQRAIPQRQSLLITLSQLAQKRKEEAEQHKAQEAVVRENFDEEVEPQKPKKTSKFVRFLRVVGTLIADSFVAPPSDVDERSTDYNSREDEKYVLDKIKASIKKLGWYTAGFSAVFIALTVLNILERSGIFNGSNALLYCGLNLIILIALGIFGRRPIVDGLRPLKRLKGNSDTAASFAYLACLIQGVAAMFTAPSFCGADHHLYGYIAAFAMTLNAVGHLLMTVRVKRNFSFITSHSPAYAAKFYTDE